MVNTTASAWEKAASDEFWAFSLALYARAGVPERCLRLQDEGGLDVNLVLFCLWSGLSRGAPPAPVWPQILRLAEIWAEIVVVPLRRIRRAMKGGFAPEEAALLQADAVRSEVKRLELAAEERQQRALAGFAAPAASPAGAAAAQQAFDDYLAARIGARPAPALLESCWTPLLAEAQALLAEESGRAPVATGDENSR